jgi:hypothetical protein
MSLELELRKAALKPDAILRMISERFGFKLGIPKHFISKNLMKTTSEIIYRNNPVNGIKISCELRNSYFKDFPAYLYRYKGVIFNGLFMPAHYRAWVFENFQGCRGEMMQGLLLNYAKIKEFLSGL